MSEPGGFSPVPVVVVPQVSASVAAALDELEELAVGDGGGVDGEARHRDRAPRELVVPAEVEAVEIGAECGVARVDLDRARAQPGAQRVDRRDRGAAESREGEPL